MCVKDVKYNLYGLKKTCLGVLDRRERDKDNETDLKEGGGIEMSTAVLHSRCSLLRFEYLRGVVSGSKTFDQQFETFVVQFN